MADSLYAPGTNGPQGPVDLLALSIAERVVGRLEDEGFVVLRHRAAGRRPEANRTRP